MALFETLAGGSIDRVLLIYGEVCLENRDDALAIRREFSSWVRAIEAATSPIEPADG